MSNPWETSNPWGKGSKEWKRWMEPNHSPQPNALSKSGLEPMSLEQEDNSMEGEMAFSIQEDFNPVSRDFGGWQSVESGWYISIDYGFYNANGVRQRANAVAETFLDLRAENYGYPSNPNGSIINNERMISGIRSYHLISHEVLLDLNGKILEEFYTKVHIVINSEGVPIRLDRTRESVQGVARSEALKQAVAFTQQYLDPKSGHGIPTPNYIQWQKAKQLASAVNTIGKFMIMEGARYIPVIKDFARFVKLFFDLIPRDIYADERELMETRSIVFERTFSAHRVDGRLFWTISNSTPGADFDREDFDDNVDSPAWVPQILYREFI